MNAWRKWIPLLAALIFLSVALGWLFQLRLGGGDLYPEYSSLRADAIGTRALYEALGLVPGLEVERDYRPLAKLGSKPRLVMMPGLQWQEWQSVPVNQLAALNAAAGNGARIVLAFRADQKREDRDEKGRVVPADQETKDKLEQETKDKKEKDKTKKKSHRANPEESRALAKEWGMTMKQRWLLPAEEGANVADEISENLPAHLAWHSDVYFSLTADSVWRVLYRRAGEAVLIEKKVGRGSIVLMADAYCLSNEAMHRDRATPLLSWLVGDYRRITFIESTLGVLEENGVGFLARRYGLGGALALGVLLGILYAWRQLVAFMPPNESDETEAEKLNYEPGTGFTALLRRSLGPADVLRACMEEWRKGRRGAAGNKSAEARLEAAWQSHDPKQSLSSNYNALARSLKPR